MVDLFDKVEPEQFIGKLATACESPVFYRRDRVVLAVNGQLSV